MPRAPAVKASGLGKTPRHYLNQPTEAPTMNTTRQEYRPELVKARHASKMAATKFAELKASADESWNKMATAMEKVRDAFVHSVKYFKSQI